MGTASRLINGTCEVAEETAHRLQQAIAELDYLHLVPVGSKEPISLVLQRGTDLVLIDRKPSGVDAPANLSENEEGAYQPTAHLIQPGRRRIGIILGLTDVTTAAERRSGYRQALEDNGTAFASELAVCGASQVREGIKASRTWLEQSDPATAVFAANNPMNPGALQASRSPGLSCPEEIPLVWI